MENSEKEDREKDKIFYSAMVSAWLNTKIERDKQLLTLSSSAIGLLITLYRTIGTSTIFEATCYALSLFAFLTAVISILLILGENATHIKEVANGAESESKFLSFLDRIAICSFTLAMILVVTIGINSLVLNTKS